MFDELDYRREVWADALDDALNRALDAVNSDDPARRDVLIARIAFSHERMKHFEDAVLARDGGKQEADTTDEKMNTV